VIEKKLVKEAEYLTADEYNALEAVEESSEVFTTDWEQTMQTLSTPGSTLTIPRNKEFNRKQVVTAFQNAFELVGGVPRLALWAHTNPGDFFKLYARLLPSQASSALGESNELVIKHVLPRGALDD
jgi:hypothetical protein